MSSMVELALGAAFISDRLIYTQGTVDASVAWFPDRMVALDLRVSVGDQAHYLSPILVTPTAEVGEVVLSEQYMGTLSAQFAPFPAEATIGRSHVLVDPYLLAGTGLIRTSDEFSVCCPMGGSLETYRQTHPALVAGGGVRVRRGAWGGRFQVDQARWIEVIDDVYLQMSRRLSLSAAVTFTAGDH